MAEKPQFTAIPRVGLARLSTPNTAVDGTGTIAELFQAGSNGSRIELFRVQATGSVDPGKVTIFLTSASVTSLYREILVASTSASLSSSMFSATEILADELFLPSGSSIGVAVSVNSPINVFAVGGDF